MTLNSIVANFQTFKLVDLLDILIIAFLIYQLLGIVNRTRAGQLAKGALLVLVVKGVLCFLAVYLLIATTGMERVCAALRQLHVPQVLVTTILLTYRYIVLLLQEGNRISTAYALRAPGEKGIHFRAWGSLLGQLLLRSVDRAQLVYESMMLRGYGWRDDPAPTRQPQKGSAAGTVFFVATLMYCILFRVIPIFELLGQFF